MPAHSDSAPPGWEVLFEPEGRERLEAVEAALAAGASAATVGARLRTEGVAGDSVAALLTQAELRRKARGKFGEAARHLLFTPAGLEQASRLAVARLHAARFASAGCTLVADLGCGIGAESLALRMVGIGVLAVEIDPFTARVARHNLESGEGSAGAVPAARVLTADATATALGGVDGVYLDPARRSAGHSDTRRITDVDAYSPPLSFAFDLAGRMPAGIKLGPGFPRERIPDEAEAQWVSVDGQLVEMGLWFGGAARPEARRSALVLRSDEVHELSAPCDTEDTEVRELGEYLYEPDGSVIRARLIGALAETLGAGMLDERIAYLTADSAAPTPFAQAFRVVERLPVREKELRRALAARGIGALEIKKRGADVDPAALRKRLKLGGPNSAMLFLTRAAGRHIALLAERC